MRLTEIIKENENLNREYDLIINETTSKFWETLLDMHGKPLSESAINDEVKALEGMLFQVGLHLPDNQRVRFFEELQNPTQLNEGVMDWAKKAGSAVATGIAKTQDAIDVGKKKVAGALIGGAKKIWDNYIPQSVKDMGATIAKKVGDVLNVMIEKAGVLLGKLAKKLQTLGASDPCFRGAVNESEMLQEAISNLYFEGSKEGFLTDNMATIKAAGDIPTQTAKAITLLKKAGTDVFGVDVRTILHDIYKMNNKPNEASELINTGKYGGQPYSVAKWFKDNGVKAKIKGFENAENPQVDTETGAPICEMTPGFIDKYFGSDSEVGKAWTKLGLDKETALGGMVSKLSENKTSMFITLGSIILTFASGAGALRIAGLVFSSVIPLLITARIDNLKEKGAPEDQIAFWEKARSISKFVNTMIQIFNIGNLIAKGWEAVADTNIDKLQQAEQLVDVNVGAGKGFANLSTDSQTVINNWTAPDGNLEMNPASVKKFFDEVAPNMTEEQFAKFNELASSTKNYNELVQIMDNPTGNGIIDIDADGVANAAKVAGATGETAADAATDAAKDLSTQTNITQEEILKAAGMRAKDLESFTQEAQIAYAKDMLGTNEFKIAMGYTLSEEEYADLVAETSYDENPLSAASIKYLEDNFGDRKDEIVKNAYRAVAAEKGIKLPDQFNIQDEVKLPGDFEAADKLRGDMIEDIPDYGSIADENITSDQVRKLYYAMGEDEAKMNEIATLVKSGKISADEVDELIDAGVNTGQTHDALYNGIKKASEAKEVATDTVTDTAKEQPVEINDETVKTGEEVVGDKTVATATPKDTGLTDELKNVGNSLESSEMMGKMPDGMKNIVGEKIMQDYSNNPDFAKAWDSPGFDKEGYIKQLATQQGWFEPIDKTQLVADLKAAGIQTQEVAKQVGEGLTNQYNTDAVFREKWNSMSAAEKTEYLTKAKDEAGEMIARNGLAAEIMINDTKASVLDSQSQKYLSGELRTDPDLAKNWATMDDTAKDAAIERAKASANYERVANINIIKTFQAGVEMNSNENMMVGHAIANGGYSQATIDKINKLSNINYGDNSLTFRKALKVALNSGDETQVKSLLDAVRDGKGDYIRELATKHRIG